MFCTKLKEPCSCSKVPDDLYTYFPNILWVQKKKEPRCICPSEAKASLGLIILMTSGSKKGSQIYFSFLSKFPVNEPPYSFPRRAPMEREARLQGILHISLFWVPQ
jgi:hypothetical protein